MGRTARRLPPPGLCRLSRKHRAPEPARPLPPPGASNEGGPINAQGTVRNPPSAVLGIDWQSLDGSQAGSFAYATEAENYYSVPEEIRTTNDEVRLTIGYRDGSRHPTVVTGKALTREQAIYTL